MYAYDGAISIIKSLEDSDNINQARINLLDLSFNGASGEVGFDSDGDRTGVAYILYRVENSQFVKQ